MTTNEKEADQLFDNAAMPIARVQGHVQHVMSETIAELNRLKPGHYLAPLIAQWRSEMLAEIARAQEQIKHTQQVLRDS